jgi:hypothetical protein
MQIAISDTLLDPWVGRPFKESDERFFQVAGACASLTFPDYENFPAERKQCRLVARITFNIPYEFGRPITQIGSRLMCGSTLVGVPKASMHEDGLVSSRKDNIGLTRQLRTVQTVTISKPI